MRAGVLLEVLTRVSTTTPAEVSSSSTTIPLTSTSGLGSSGTNYAKVGDEEISYTGIGTAPFLTETSTTLSQAITNTLRPSTTSLISSLGLSTDSNNTLYFADNTTFPASSTFLIDNERVSYTGYGSPIYSSDTNAEIYVSKTTTTEITNTSTTFSLNNMTNLPNTGEINIGG